MGQDRRRTLMIILLMIITLCIIIVVVIFLKPESRNPMEITAISISSIIGVLSLYFVVSEYKRARNIEEGQFIFNLNNEFINNSDIKDLYDKVYREKKDSSLHLILDSDLSKITSYLTFLETFWTMYERNIIHIDMIDDLFASRFFLMITNKNIQKLKLVSDYNIYNNIRNLERVWRQYRVKKNLPNLCLHYSLNKVISVENAQRCFNIKQDTSDYRFKVLSEKNLDEVLLLQDKVIETLDNKAYLYQTSKEDYRDILKDGENICCGVYYSEKLVAYSFFTFPKYNFLVYKKRFLIPRLHKNNMYFKVVVVDKYHRNKGIQKACLEVAKEHARFYKIKRIITTVHPDNSISCHSFKKYNFKHVKTKRVHNDIVRNILEYRL